MGVQVACAFIGVSWALTYALRLGRVLFAEDGFDDLLNVDIVRTAWKSGRRVAVQPAQMPMPHSMVDQSKTGATPTVNSVNR